MRHRNTAVCLIVAAAVGLSMAGGCATDGDIAAQSESERAGWKGGSDKPDPKAVAEGRRIAQSKCAACHSIDESSVSRNAGAPPFRDFAFLNDPYWVSYRLIDGMRLGHDDMPLFDFDVRSADALMAYISTLND